VIKKYVHAWGQVGPVPVLPAVAVLLLALFALFGWMLVRAALRYWRARKAENANNGEPTGLPAGTLMYYVAAAACMAVSLNTSYRVFGEILDIKGLERVSMFAAAEIFLLAAALGMRASVLKDGTPGIHRPTAWALVGLTTWGAFLVGGPLGGSIRSGLMIFGLIAFHNALGIEIRSRREQRTDLWARVARELRERVLSRLGLADDQRDALARTRDRNARKAAYLSLPKDQRGPRRLTKALQRSNVAHDPTVMRQMLAELAMLNHANKLRSIQQPPPWSAVLTASRPVSTAGQHDSTPVGVLTGQGTVSTSRPVSNDPASAASGQEAVSFPASPRPDADDDTTELTGLDFTDHNTTLTGQQLGDRPGPVTATPSQLALEPTAPEHGDEDERTDEEWVIQTLEPIAVHLEREGDWLSREDVRRIVPGANGTQAGSGRATRLLGLLNERHPEHPAAQSRRTPDRQRTIDRALSQRPVAAVSNA
jgi:hypothetical protein